MNGAQMIAYERERQKMVEGYTAQHDMMHNESELLHAAESYIDAASKRVHSLLDYAVEPCSWPFESSAWKPSPDPIRMLVKAGALIAAEIDRLQREKDKRHA